MRPNLVFALLFPVSLAANFALGAPGGELDPDFGDHGRILLQETPFEDLGGVHVFFDTANSKLTMVADGYGRDRLLRFNSDGSLDQSFGDQGTALLDYFGDDDDADIYDVERIPGGQLLIAGALNVYGTPDNVIHGSTLLARMHADGTPDLTFGDEGQAHITLGGEFESFGKILQQPDGRIVVFGYTNRTSNGEWILARFTQDGVIDSSFGNSATPGVSVVDVTGTDASLKDIVRQTDGNFLICGDASSAPDNPDSTDIVAIRLLPDGGPDLAFGNKGMLRFDGWQDSILINSCVQLADGHLVFAGSFGSEDRERAAAWRITPDGRLDSGFGSNGMALVDTSTESRATVMTAMGDGALALAGSQWKRSTGDYAWFGWFDMLVARIDPITGAVDQNFGNRGSTAVDFGTGKFSSSAYSANVTQQPDGKLVVVGAQVDWYDWWPAYSIAMARIDPYGSGSNGWVSMAEAHVDAPAAGGIVGLGLRRTGGSTGELSVDFETVDNTATAGEDYSAVRGTVTWPDGDFSDKVISISVSTAHLATTYESFNVALSNSSGGLGMDQATIGISRPASSSAPPPKTRPDGPGGTGVTGGGAMGAELLWLLLLLSAPAGLLFAKVDSSVVFPVFVTAPKD
jgi:uncharacterized delta-60 repeat protein